MDIKEKSSSERKSSTNKNPKSRSAVIKNFIKAATQRGFFAKEERQYISQGDNSFAFVNCIGRVFDTCNSTSKFHNAFTQVITGGGQEKDKINTLHSSSLLGLLCFYAINDTNRLKFTLPFNGKDVEFEFNEVKFEKTNPVFYPSVGKSHIDIALYGYANGKLAVLYLESKFSEYLSNAKSSFSKKYKYFYDELDKEGCFSQLNIVYNNNDGVNDNDNDNDNDLELSGKHYCEGLKQMISHTIGAINSDEEEREIYLAPILFNFWNTSNETPFSRYSVAYSRLAQGLVKLINKLGDLDDYSQFFEDEYKVKPTLKKNSNKLFISDKVFSYQEFFKNADFELPQAVKEYYNL